MALISVTELQQLIADTLSARRRTPERENIALLQANNRVLARDIQAGINIPAADISVLIPDSGGVPDTGTVKATKAPEGAATIRLAVRYQRADGRVELTEARELRVLLIYCSMRLRCDDFQAFTLRFRQLPGWHHDAGFVRRHAGFNAALDQVGKDGFGRHRTSVL